MKNARYTNEQGGILVEQENGTDLYLDSGPEYDRVVAEMAPTPFAPPPPDVSDVKFEAMRRILEIAPEWRQRNLTARAVVLTQKGQASWTVEEQAEWDAGMVLWQQIEAIRAASDAIEAMTEIPQDYTSDIYWPTGA